MRVGQKSFRHQTRYLLLHSYCNTDNNVRTERNESKSKQNFPVNTHYTSHSINDIETNRKLFNSNYKFRSSLWEPTVRIYCITPYIVIESKALRW